MTGSDVHTTLREMWDTRPARPREGRQVAGVAAAIARRYDIDPVLVRVGFVVAAFWGIGAALYVAGWLLLPDEPGPVTSGRRRTWLLVLIGIAAVLGLGGASRGGGGILLPAVAVAALLFLLHRTRGSRGLQGAGPGVSGAAMGPAGPATGTPDAPAVAPPAWDPLGAAPFAWDLPEPGPAPAPPPRPRSRVTPITLALALLAGGVTALVLLATGGPTDVPVLAGVILAVLGGGLLVGSVVRGGRGLVPFALLGIAVTWGLLAAPWERVGAGPVEDLRLAPATAAALAPRYETGMGDVELDLRRMDLTVPPGAAATPITTTINTGVGEVDVLVPPDADVRLRAESGMGSIEFAGEEHDGPGAQLDRTDLGADGVASGRPIVLTVHSGMGDVDVRRG